MFNSSLVFTTTPHHEHDCDACTYAGSVQGHELGRVDVYRSCDGSQHEYILRYGTMGDYCTVWEDHPQEAFCRAVEALYNAEKPKYGEYQYNEWVEASTRDMDQYKEVV